MTDMTLTKTDLKAIKQIVDDAIDDSKLHTAAGFAGVDAKLAEADAKLDASVLQLQTSIDSIDNRLAVKDGKLEDTVLRVDNIETQIPNFKPYRV